jgi:hypothetical protein
VMMVRPGLTEDGPAPQADAQARTACSYDVAAGVD